MGAHATWTAFVLDGDDGKATYTAEGCGEHLKYTAEATDGAFGTGRLTLVSRARTASSTERLAKDLTCRRADIATR